MPTARRTIPLACLLLGAVLLGCSAGGAEVPEGYQTVSHPFARLAVPESWSASDAGAATERDQDAVTYAVPGADGEQFGVTVWHSPGSGEHAAEDLLVQLTAPLQRADGFEQLAREDDLEVPGSDEAASRRVAFVAPALDAPVRATIVTAAADDGVVVVELLGTAEQIDDETLDTIVSTLEITGG